MDRLFETGYARARTVDTPFCHHCGRPLQLIRSEPVEPGCEKHTVKCDLCEREESILIAQPPRGTT
jgi:hypothetical protein